jgi:hypothetical protein
VIRLVLALLFSAHAFAVPIAKLQVDGRTSSALLFREGDRTFALTSSEAVVLSREPLKHPHTLALGEENPSPAELKIADWANGIALLEWTGRKPEASWPTRAQVVSEKRATSKLQLLSARASSDHATIIARTSTRHTLAEAKPVMEVEGAVIDATYVGGALADQTGNVFGMISGEHLLLTPGYPTMPHKWTSAEQRSHILVLGATHVKAWLAGSPSPLRRFVEDQAPDTERVLDPDRAYEAVCPPIGSKPGSGEFPVGGSNGLGSGGGIPGVHACRIRETIHGVTREIAFSFRRDPDSGELDHDAFYSLGEMFPLTRRAGWSIATVQTASANETKLRTLGRDAAIAASKQYGDLGVRNAKLSQVVRMGFLLGKLAESDQATVLSKGDFDRLLDPNGPYASAWGWIPALYPLVKDYHVREKLESVKGALP